MSRSKHQFRPGALELFETRIVPSTMAIDGGAYNPPGISSPEGVYTTGFVTPSGFSVNGDVVSTTLTNSSGIDRYATFAVYAAEGQGFNIASQNLIYQQTYKIPAGQSLLVSVDLSTLKIPGQGKVQCDIWEADDASGYAPDKLKPDSTGFQSHLLLGELFQYQPDDAKKNK